MVRTVLVLSIALFASLTLHSVSAQDATPFIPVALAPLDRQSPLELTALTVDAEISEVNGRTIASGTAVFKMHNTDLANPVEVVVGFPEWASPSANFDPAAFTSFQVSVDGKTPPFGETTAPVRYGETEREVKWYTFKVTLEPDEKKTVTTDFVQDLGDSLFPRFTYGILVGNRWKNAVGSARITVKMPSTTTNEQFVALDPTLPTFDGQRVTWLWTNLNPDADPGITLIRPSTWQSLLAQRALVVQNPEDAGARLQLGLIYKELASVESPRRDNWLSQAVAEFEMAARLEPDNVRAVRLLAELYEQRAGAPNGPRDASYVTLAMDHWQKLIGTRADADARKQLGEDSFFLALDARARGEFERALKLFQDARTFAPDGAGPLYTPERLVNELQATRVAAARAEVDKGNITSALTYARAAYGDNFEEGFGDYLSAVMLNRATISTTLGERRIQLRLVAYPAKSDASTKEVLAVASAMNASGVAAAMLEEDESSYTLTLTIPFASDADLKDSLTKLVQAIPDRPDWALVRDVLSPASLDLKAEDDTFARRLFYREEVDLRPGQAKIQTVLNKMSADIGAWSAASQHDADTQLKLALAQHTQNWWYKALSSLVLTYHFDAGGGVTRDWTISVGSNRILEYNAETFRPEWYLVGAGCGIATLALLLILFFLVTRRRRPQPA